MSRRAYLMLNIDYDQYLSLLRHDELKMLDYQWACALQRPKWMKEWEKKVATEKKKPKEEREKLCKKKRAAWLAELEGQLLADLPESHGLRSQITKSINPTRNRIVGIAISLAVPLVFL